MPPDGPANAEGQVGFSFHLIARQQRPKQSATAGEEGFRAPAALDMCRAGAKATRLPRLLNILGLVKKTHVDDQSGIPRHAPTI